MSVEMNQIAGELLSKIQSRFNSVSLGDEKGVEFDELGKLGNRPTDDQARFFSFVYSDRSGKEYGPVTSFLKDADHNNSDPALEMMFGPDISSNLSDTEKAEWYDFLRDMRGFAKRNRLRFDVKDPTKSKFKTKTPQLLNPAEMKNVAKNSTSFDPAEVNTNESRMFGSTKRSYYPINERTRLVIKHNGHIDELKHGARTRQIESVFIEDADGQRLKCPTNMLLCCKALGQHVAAGGQLHDDFGQHIVSLGKELSEIKRFAQVSSRKTFEDSEATEIASAAKNRYHQIRRTLESVTGPRGYHSYKESWVPEEETNDDFNLEEIKSKFVQKNFDTRLEGGMPYAYKAHKQAKAQQHIDEFAAWADEVTESPDLDNKQKEDLQTMMSEPLEAGYAGENAIATLQRLGIEDPELNNIIHTSSKGSKDADCRPYVYDWLKVNRPNEFENVKKNMETGEEPDAPEEAPAPDATAQPEAPEQDVEQQQQPMQEDALTAMRRLAGIK
jgi:hypothetical protein